MTVKYNAENLYEGLRIAINSACFYGKDLLEAKGKPEKANAVLNKLKTEFAIQVDQDINRSNPKDYENIEESIYSRTRHNFGIRLQGFADFIFDTEAEAKYFTREVLANFDMIYLQTAIIEESK